MRQVRREIRLLINLKTYKMTKKELLQINEDIVQENIQLRRKLNLGVQLTYQRFYQLQGIEETVKEKTIEVNKLMTISEKLTDTITNLSIALAKEKL